jgi:hypothetical protein
MLTEGERTAISAVEGAAVMRRRELHGCSLPRADSAENMHCNAALTVSKYGV